MADRPAHDHVAAKIRAGLLSSLGAERCGLCPVITQGGLKGMREHLKVVHDDRRTT